MKETTEKVINKKEGFLNPLMRVGLPLMKNVLKSQAKIVVLLLGVAATTSAVDA